MKFIINNNWNELFKPQFSEKYFLELQNFIEQEYKTQTIFPPENLIFNAFNLCPFDKIKVVILGQDPYHGKNQSHGLCFSVQDNVKIPPSLRNVFKELQADLNIDSPQTGNLENWAKQGVLLLNATFTVREAQAGSHQNKGWETFSDFIIKKISDEKENVVFLLWGAYARKKNILIDENKHEILSSAHPSPLSAHRGFLGNKHFSKTNEYLTSKDIKPIIWKN